MQEAIDLVVNYLKGIWVKRWILVVMAWLVCLAGWPFVLKMPDQYQSEAKVYVDTDSLLAPLLRGLTIQTNPQQQVQLMVKTLFTRPNLEKIARLADLDLQAKTPDEFNAVIDSLKSDLKLSTAGRSNIYAIQYSHKSAEKARDVVQATLTSLVENTLGDKREDTNIASSFIDRQIAEYEQRLNETDNALKEFKQRNYDVMGSSGDFYSRLEQLKGSIRGITLELKEAEARRDSLQRQLEGEVPTFGLVEESYSGQQFDIGTSYDNRIATLENKLDELRLRYTDIHPDIKETQRVLADLQNKQQQEIRDRRKAMETVEARRRSVDENPVYQELKLSLSREESTVQSLRVRLDDQQQRFESLQLKVNTIPEIEAEYQALQRGYNVTQQKYNELLSRRESAHLSQQAEVSADSFQFRVIDPPRVPTTPVGPKRPLFLTAVLVLGLGAGVALAFVASQVRPVFFSSRQLSSVTGFPVLGAVSVVQELRDRNVRKRTHWYFALTLLLLMIYAALMVLQLFPALNNSLIERLPDIPQMIDQLLPKLKAVAHKLTSVIQG
ncbi:XrtA system polysaccharide chain length determinant [Motiliproteus sediminis]|uniref:XrtA system polysaccharide chain length determinant n=1 Tax=Motiliproteus sediminis TaxID=1468178 RepID=UPI001AEFCE41|nr:XrtA system polysaccharide chain length determinant [Motiliproteus sediminis]